MYMVVQLFGSYVGNPWLLIVLLIYVLKCTAVGYNREKSSVDANVIQDSKCIKNDLQK